MSKNKIIGIDLGTTNSVVSIIEAGEPVVILNEQGKRTTPSIISFKDGERKVGEPAKRQAAVNPDGTVSSIKRFMGRSWKEASADAKKVNYSVKKSKSNGVVVELNGKEYSPQELSAMVLQKLKKAAEDYLGYEVSRAVITVPAYFNDSQRKATTEAGQIAGLEVERIINEPTAAALAYGLDKKADQKVAVFDLGGGTFDISILEISSDGVFEVLSTDGDTQLGGDDFDEVIIEFMVEEFKKAEGIDLTQDPKAMQRIKEAAENTKIELSSSSSADIDLPYITMTEDGPKNLQTSLTRAKFEQLIDTLVKRCMKPVSTALKNAKLKKSEINEIILVGGSTRIPAVQEAVKAFFGKDLNKSINPDESVAIGAAVQGAIIGGDKSVGDILLLDVTPLSLGLETMGGMATKIIEANTTIPTQKSQIFSTAADNQPSVEIHIVQGEREFARDNKSLGRFHLDGIPPAPRGVPQIEVTFDIDANGILSVTAKDTATGTEKDIRIESSTGLSEDEIKQMKRDAEENAEADAAAKEKIEQLNKADMLAYQTEQFMNQNSEKLEDEEKETLQALVDEVKELHNAADMEALEEKVNALQEQWTTISTRLYQHAQEEAATNVGTEAETEEAEVEVEEVE